MSALFCLFLCFRSYPEKLEVYTPTFYKIRYILEELYVAVIWIISRLIICIDQLNAGHIQNELESWSNLVILCLASQIYLNSDAPVPYTYITGQHLAECKTVSHHFLHARRALDTFLQRSTKIHSVCFIKKDKNDMNMNKNANVSWCQKSYSS